MALAEIITAAVSSITTTVTNAVSGTQQRNFEREQYSWSATQDKQQYKAPTDYNRYFLIVLGILIFILFIALIFKGNSQK